MSVISAVLDVQRITASVRALDRLARGEQHRDGSESLMHPWTLRFRDPRLEMLYFSFRTQPGHVFIESRWQLLLLISL